MKKNRIYFSFLFGLLLFSIFFSNVYAIEYELGVNEKDSFIWEVKKFEESTYNKYFSEEADFVEGVSKKYEITDIEDKSDKWIITYDVWDYTKNADKFSEDPDSDESMNLYKDPEDKAERVYTLDDLLDMWVVPTPLQNYLEEFRDNFENNIINIYIDNDGTLRAKYAFEHIEYDIELSYTLDGVLETINYVESDGGVFVTINLYRDAIPSYTFLIVPITIFGIIIIGSYLYKNKKININ